MSELLQEYVDSARVPLGVDRAGGVIRGVKLLGLRSRNARRYCEDALRDATSLYEGTRVNVNHPKGHPLSPRDYQDRLGVIRGVRFRVGEGLFGDLYFNPKHALSEQLVWDAEHAPQNVGMSHNVLARTRRSGQETVVEAITKVQSIDLVADPATTAGLFEHADESRRTDNPVRPPLSDGQDCPSYAYDQLTLEALRLHRADLIHEIEQPHRAEIDDVRRRLDEVLVREAAAERRERIRELLAAHHLPLPGGNGAVDSHLTSPRFIESLMHAADDAAVRRLIEERVELLRTAASWQARPPVHRPRSRDQTTLATGGTARPRSAEDFAAAIRTR
jgi:hypothetical protein